MEQEIKRFTEELYNKTFGKGQDTLDEFDWEDIASVIEDTARHFAEWQKAQDDKMVDIIYQQGIEKGKDDMKEQMLKKAVEGKVFMSFAPGHNQMVMADTNLPTNTKVKLIIVKEEEK